MSLDVIAIVVYVATILERLLELFISKRNEAWSLQNGGVEYGAGHYKYMVVMHTMFLLAMPFEFFMFGQQVPQSLRICAIVASSLCQVIRWWVITTLGRQWNTKVIIIPGSKRITSGPYRYLSHPNYMIVTVETIALPLIFSAWRTAGLFFVANLIVLWIRIRIEDKALENLS